MPEKLAPEIRAKIIKLRKEGKSFVQIEDELKVKRGALSHIGSRSWFVAAMKEKGEDRKTGYRLFSEAKKTKLKSRRKARDEAAKEKEKKEKKEKKITKSEGPEAAAKEVIDAEVESHLKGSDKDPRRVKQKKEPGTGGGDGDKTKKEKAKKGKGGLVIVLILVAAAILIVAVFMVFGRKEKGKEPGEESGKEAPDFNGRPFDDL